MAPNFYLNERLILAIAVTAVSDVNWLGCGFRSASVLGNWKKRKYIKYNSGM